ncbi:MAG: site-specific integrase [Clostridia bacterium]|nr:site-specific integrase [Clostridia bacterium]
MAKRSNKEGSIRQRKKGLWEGRYTEGRDENGKLISRSVYGKTRDQVVAKLAKIRADIDSGEYVTPTDITLSEWLDIWADKYLDSPKQSTKSQYQYQIRTHIKPYIGNYKLQQITAPILQDYYKTMMKPHKISCSDKKERESKGLSAKSIKNLNSVLHGAFKQAILCNYRHDNPCLGCKLPRIEKKEMHTLTDDTMKAFFKEIHGKPYEELFMVDVFSGLRESEIIGLTWDCIDFKQQIIFISKQLKRERQAEGGNVYRFDSLKNGKTRSVTPAKIVFDILKNVRAKQNELKLASSDPGFNKDNLVFTDRNGNHLASPTVYNNFKARAKAIGLPDLRFHDLRHTYATLSIQNGDELKTVSENLGHFSVWFTADTYAHVTQRMKKESADKMQAYYERISK